MMFAKKKKKIKLKLEIFEFIIFVSRCNTKNRSLLFFLKKFSLQFRYLYSLVFFIDLNRTFAMKFRMEGVSQSGGWLRFWTGNEQLSGQSELISRSERRRRKGGEGRKLVHESVVARDRVVVHERDP